MCEEIEIAGIKIPKADWDATPLSVQMLVRVLSERLEQLEEKLGQNSQNSSRPPSSDGFGNQPKAEDKKDKREKRPNRTAGDTSRQAHKLYPSEDCSAVHEQIPTVCGACGAALRGVDAHPHRHQVVEVPPMSPQVIEYRLHQLTCEQCGAQTRGGLPEGVSSSGYGVRLTALVSLLRGEYRQSYRQVSGLMSELFAIALSRGGVGRLCQEMSQALLAPVSAAQDYVQRQAVMNSDETSFPQGNGDGLNSKQSKGWLWVLATPWVSFFEVVLSRSQATAKALIGEAFSGMVTSDRYSAYNWIALEQRQLCWAHLKRDLTAIAERSGVSQAIGEALLRRQRRLFRWWYQVRAGTLGRADFCQRVSHLRAGFKAELALAANLPIGRHEKTPLAKTVRTCQQLLKLEPALWTFVYTPGLEPTNNDAERALRPAVIWRRISFGSQSEAGSQFVARMLTVTASLKAQNRAVLDFLTQACHAARLGLPGPSLLPQSCSLIAAPSEGKSLSAA